MEKKLTSRELMHHNYNGGWHGEGNTHEAYHHGMDIGFNIGLATAEQFIRERTHFGEQRGEVGPFTKEEMSWWLESMKTGEWPNGNEI